MWFLNKILFETFLRTNNILNKSHLFGRFKTKREAVEVRKIDEKRTLENIGRRQL